jgi:hypothetical protein
MVSVRGAVFVDEPTEHVLPLDTKRWGVCTDYIYGPDDLPIEQTNTAGTTISYLQHDQQGSTRLLTDPSGAVVGTYNYTPNGTTLNHAGTSSVVCVCCSIPLRVQAMASITRPSGTSADPFTRLETDL